MVNIILVMLGALFYRLRGRETATGAGPTSRIFRLSHQTGWAGVGVITVSLAYAGFNLFILVCGVGTHITIGEPLNGDNGTFAFPDYGYPAVAMGIIALGTLYYISVFGAAVRKYSPTPDLCSDEVVERGLLSKNTWWNLLRVGNVEVEIRTDRYYNDHLPRVSRFGRRWSASYTPWSLGHVSFCSFFFSLT
jgi:hypothetical protein